MPLAIVPACQPIVDALHGYLARENISKMALAARIWGHDQDGKTKGTGALYPYLNGKRPPGRIAIAMIRAATGLDLPLIANPAEMAPPTTRPPAGPARTAVRAYQRARQVAPVPPEAWGQSARHDPASLPVTLPRFALAIDQHGRTNLTLNLVDVPARDALRVYEVLSACGLIEPG